jgi:hypothetical protein
VVLVTAISAKAEDWAVCAGVNHYPHLRAGANLDGCVNDAKLFAEKLQQLGFHAPVILTDSQATKAGILSSITALKSHLHNGDRVVVYFAGHGTLATNGNAVILPSDAQDSSEINDIQVKDLYDAVKGLGGAEIQKTVVLDSCHSGGMIRGIPGLRSFHNLRPRLYVRTRDLDKSVPGTPGVKKWQETSANGGDDLTNVVRDVNPMGTSGICYFTAAQKNEVANETEVDGTQHGLFTYYLVGALQKSGELWRNVSAQVSGKVAGDTGYEQKPQLYPTSIMDRVVFGGTASAPAKPLGLDAIYNLSNPDPERITIKRYLEGSQPEQAPISVGSRNYFEIKVGRDGYLAVIGRDPTNQLDVLYPSTPTREALQVRAGQVIRIPGNVSHYMVPDAAGSDGVKAILFGSAEKALALLAPFKPATGDGYSSLTVEGASRAWKETADSNTGDDHFYTSEITTQIVPAANEGH